MILTKELLNAMGSGIDPKDKECINGFTFFCTYFDVGMTFTEGHNKLIAMIRSGEIPRDKGLSYLKWGYVVRKSALAIELGGTFALLNSFTTSIDNTVFSSKQEALTYKSNYIDSFTKTPFSEINICRIVQNEDQIITIAITDKLEIREGYCYFYLNRATGVQEKMVNHLDVLARLEKETEYLANNKVKNIQVFQKIVDTVEGFKAWKPIKDI